jgi:hypothetical protein
MIDIKEAAKNTVSAYKLSNGKFAATPEEWVVRETELSRRKSLDLLEARVTKDSRVNTFILDNIDLLVQIVKDPGSL